MSQHVPRIRSVWISALVGTVLMVAGMAFLRLEVTIRAPGVVRAQDERRIFAPAAGIVARHHARTGQDVQPGDLLVELDDTSLAMQAVALERDLNETTAALERNAIALREIEVMPASLEMLTADERQDRLGRITAIQQQIESSYASGHDQQIISELELRKQEIEKLRAEMDLLQAKMLADWRKAGAPAFEKERLQVEQKRLEALRALIGRELELVAARRNALRVTAPIAGRVVAVEVRFPGMSVQEGQELLKVAALDNRYEVRTRIPERNVDLVQVGSPALMESGVFDSMLEGYVRGSVTRVAPEAERAEGEAAIPADGAQYEVEIAVEETPYPLVLGSRVNVIITLGKRPLSELLFRSARSLRGPAARPEKT